MHYSWIIYGQPIGKGRPRFARAGGFVRTYTPAKTALWEGDAADVFASQWHAAPLDCPVVLRVTSIFARPKRLMRAKDPPGRIPCVVKPDWDNVGKVASDALQKAGVIRDDSLVYDGRSMKFYAAIDEGPRVEVELETIHEVV